MKQYIVFDMDGVLFDSEQLISRCWKEVGAKMGLPHIYETFLDCVGTTQKNTQAVFQRTYPGVSYDQFQKGCRAGFFGHVDAHGMPLKSGARALLHHLREANWGIGLASSTRRVLVQSQLEGVGLWHYFDQVVTGDQLERSKPAPDIYLMACRTLGVAPEAAWAVEDSYNGIRSAAAAGMRPIMVPDLLPPTPEMRQLSHIILPDLTAVEDYLHITLTDEQDVPDALARLRVVYPNLMRLDYDNLRTREDREVTAPERTENITPLEHFAAFYELQNNQPLTDEQAAFCQQLIEDIWKEGEDA